VALSLNKLKRLGDASLVELFEQDRKLWTAMAKDAYIYTHKFIGADVRPPSAAAVAGDEGAAARGPLPRAPPPSRYDCGTSVTVGRPAGGTWTIESQAVRQAQRPDGGGRLGAVGKGADSTPISSIRAQ